MNKPYFSIIIPYFNAEKYIVECIKSALNQSFRDDFEIILVDDGSNKKGKEIIKRFSDKIKIFETEHHGPARARNFGIKQATGEYIVFLDADDVLDRDTLSTFHKTDGQSKADVIIAPYYAIRELKHDIKLYDPLKKINLEEFLNVENTHGKILKTNFEPWAKAYRREYLIENNIGFPSYLLAEDLPFYYNVLLNTNKILSARKPVYYYRRGHKEPILGGGYNPVREVIGAIEEADRIARNYPHYKKIEKIHKKNIMKVILYWNKRFIKLKNRKEIITFGRKFLSKGRLLWEFNFRYIAQKFRIN